MGGLALPFSSSVSKFLLYLKLQVSILSSFFPPPPVRSPLKDQCHVPLFTQAILLCPVPSPALVSPLPPQCFASLAVPDVAATASPLGSLTSEPRHPQVRTHSSLVHPSVHRFAHPSTSSMPHAVLDPGDGEQWNLLSL